jgi:hypothetical protein
MITKYFACIAMAALVAACDSPLNTDPTANIDAGSALTTPRGIELGTNGAYRALQGGNLYGVNEMVYPDLYSDNLTFTGTFQTDREVSLRNISPANGSILGAWQALYNGINRTNNLLDAIPRVAALTSAQRDQYRGEALFIRALHYSILARYHGGVPIVTEPSRGVGPQSLVSRATLPEVYTFIEADLEEAATLLPAGRVTGKATQEAANALLARVYLEDGKYASARDKATLLINDPTYSLMPTYTATVNGLTRVSFFATKNSSESVFELQYSVNNSNSQAFWFFTQALGGRWGFSPSLGLYNAFEAGDARRDASIGISGTSRFGNKYFRIANGDDNVIVLRLAEMYLIRAEANARLAAAPAVVRADVDVVRARAGLAALPTTITTETDLLNAILQESRVEFAMEGHRFFDLRRMGVATAVLGITPERLLFPIPQAERDVNPNLTQNPGY